MGEPRVPMSEQIACAVRELRMRERVYPRWIAQGRITQAKAEAELRAMRAIVETLQETEPRLV